MSELVLKNLSKSFGPKTILSDFNLTVRSGEFVVLVGPSGSGKSTILRLISGLESPSQGEIWIDGKLVNQTPPKDRDVSMVFQNYALYPHLTVFDNIAFPLKIRKTPKPEIQGRVKEVAELLGLVPLLDRKPATLSGGQRQRVALGRAIIRKPKLFLFDEPLSNLDAQLRTSLRAEIMRLHLRLGTSSVYVTHDQLEALTLGNRIVVLKDGLAQQEGTAQELYDRPANKFVAEFIGSPAMNLIPGRLSQDGSLSIDNQKVGAVPLGSSTKTPSGEVWLGIRPEDLTLKSFGDRDGFPCQVDFLERAGGEKYLYLKMGSMNLVAKYNGEEEFKINQEVMVGFNRDKIHLFDKATGNRTG